jgi:hypothetical protein
MIITEMISNYIESPGIINDYTEGKLSLYQYE